jgi:hypothetical protein
MSRPMLPKTKGWFDPVDRPPINPGAAKPHVSIPHSHSRLAIIDANPMFCERHGGGSVKSSPAAVRNFLHADPRGERYVEWFSYTTTFFTAEVLLYRLHPVEGAFAYFPERVNRSFFPAMEEIGAEFIEGKHVLWSISDAQLVHYIFIFDRYREIA